MRSLRLALAASPLLAALSLAALAQEAPKKDDAPKPPEAAGADDGLPSVKPTFQGEKLKRFTEAVTAFKAAEAKLAKGDVAAAKKEVAEADRRMKLMNADTPDDPLPLYYLGMLHQLQGNDHQARTNLLKVTKLSPKFFEAWTELGDAHWHLQEFKEADAAYGKALEVKPDYPTAIRNRVLVRFESANYKDALELLEKNKQFFQPTPVEKGKTGDKGGLPAYCPSYEVLEKQIKFAIEGPPWPHKFEKETENYIVKTDCDQFLADMFAERAELIRKVYVAWFDQAFKTHAKLPKGRKYPIIVFASMKEYYAFFPNMAQWGAGGHYDPSIRQLFFPKYDRPEDGWVVLQHEGLHQFLHPYLDHNPPDWFNEGLGDYFSGFKYVPVPEPAHYKVAPSAWRVGGAKNLIGSGQARSFKDMICMTHPEFYGPQKGPNYQLAWSVIYFLCQYENQKYFPLLSKYFTACHEGKDLEEAYKIAFGKEDVAKLEKEWHDFIKSLD